MKTCKDCAHFELSHGKFGHCCADIPFWVAEIDLNYSPQLVERDEKKAETCDCYEEKIILRTLNVEGTKND